MFIKVEALFEVNEGKLYFGQNAPRYLTEKINEICDDIIKAVVIEASVPAERHIIVRKV